MPEEFQRRLPSTERAISEIQPDDIRVAVIGTIIDKSKEATRIIVDDGTGKVSVSSESPLTAELNQTVRVFGRVIPLESGVELQGEVVQDMSKLDLQLHKKIKGLTKA
ncbi:MAG: replication protein RepA [Candidatus Aenigmarchaeota archaeon]|nr:replication protein RepA [Candidatus Aenigmarchaeota archaeon]